MLLSKLKISGHSMSPQIKDREKVLVSNLFFLFKSPKINDIVAFKYKNKVLIKRIKKIEGGKFFVMGDNREDSLDSNFFGYVFRKNILGKVFYKF